MWLIFPGLTQLIILQGGAVLVSGSLEIKLSTARTYPGCYAPIACDYELTIPLCFMRVFVV